MSGADSSTRGACPRAHSTRSARSPPATPTPPTWHLGARAGIVHARSAAATRRRARSQRATTRRCSRPRPSKARSLPHSATRRPAPARRGAGRGGRRSPLRSLLRLRAPRGGRWRARGPRCRRLAPGRGTVTRRGGRLRHCPHRLSLRKRGAVGPRGPSAAQCRATRERGRQRGRVCLGQALRAVP